MGVVVEGTTRAGVSGVGPSLRVNFSTPIDVPGDGGGTGDLGTWEAGDLPGRRAGAREGGRGHGPHTARRLGREGSEFAGDADG